MSSSKPNAFESIFWECLKEGLMNGDSISVSGLGVFAVNHQSGKIDMDDTEPNESDGIESSDGSISVSPPRDTIFFESEFRHSD